MTRSSRPALIFAALLVCSAAVLAASLVFGDGDLSEPELGDTLLRLRLDRFAAAYLAGAALSVGGVLAQGLFRNPLASPSIIGTTAGASFGGRVALLAQSSLFVGVGVSAELSLPVGCLLGGALALVIVLAVARWRDDSLVVLLTGFLLSSLFLSLSGFLTAIAHERWAMGRALIHFALGDVSGTSVRQLLVALPLAVGGVVAAWFWGRPLDLLASGEDEAATLGVDVSLVRHWCVVWIAVLTAAAVAVGGNLGFVGLVVPHLLRPLIGFSHRVLVPAAALAGGAYVVACDLIARVVPTASELPLGIVTGLLGAPLFLLLLVRRRWEVLGRA